MKKLLLLFLVCALFSLTISAQNASKVIYSNGLTHCYVTAVSINDSTVYYAITETSDRKIWRLTDRQETQQLGLFDKDTTIKIFKEAIALFDAKELNKEVEVTKNVKLKYYKTWGIKCVNFHNSLVGTDFNINRQTAVGALQALGVEAK